MPAEKPLFIPLLARWFDKFADGSKTEELRAYGPRWNERTCLVGRAVTLSRGYGKHARLNGRITEFHRRDGNDFGANNRAAILEVFGTNDIEIAVICIAVVMPAPTATKETP